MTSRRVRFRCGSPLLLPAMGNSVATPGAPSQFSTPVAALCRMSLALSTFHGKLNFFIKEYSSRFCTLYQLPVIPRCGRVIRRAYRVWGMDDAGIFLSQRTGAAELRRLARRESGRVCQRVLLIANMLEGMEHEEAARLAGLSRSAAYEWHNRYEEDGLEGLRDRPRPGRQPRVDSHGSTP